MSVSLAVCLNYKIKTPEIKGVKTMNGNFEPFDGS